MLTATVTELNRNGTKAVEDLKKKVDKLEADINTAQRTLQALKDQTYNQQHAMEVQVTALHAARSDFEKVRAEALESVSRVKLQIEDVGATLKSAQAHSQQRLAEKKAETEAKAKAEADVEKLKGENAELLAKLTTLRDRFKTTLQENKKLVERLLKAKERPTRKASFAP